jgi:lipoprotein lipase
MSSGTADWIIELARDYGRFVDSKVCIVDWEKLARSDYDVAVNKMVPQVGIFLADFIRRSNMPLSSVTLVGHSLGAHVAGRAGAELGGKVFLIVGLDPAGPEYTMPEDVGAKGRLDSGDAQFVQTIVTTEGFIGASFGLGKQNFFPNGGKFPQPGCGSMISGDIFDLETLSCSHEISCEYFRLSLDPSNNFTGVSCGSDGEYKAGKCVQGTNTQMKLLRPGDRMVEGDFYLDIDKDAVESFSDRFFKKQGDLKGILSDILEGIGKFFHG